MRNQFLHRDRSIGCLHKWKLLKWRKEVNQNIFSVTEQTRKSIIPEMSKLTGIIGIFKWNWVQNSVQLVVPLKESSDWKFLLSTSPSKLIARKKECKSCRKCPPSKQRRKQPQPQPQTVKCTNQILWNL